ncbi:MAG: hypothetical protein HW390_1334 [Candidatus Brocadiaceae bacterium]|nr:hypothetical protein [Candidatus Brocadiaceae bacterium]
MDIFGAGGDGFPVDDVLYACFSQVVGKYLLLIGNKGKDEVDTFKFFDEGRRQLGVINEEEGVVCMVKPADGVGVKTSFGNFQQGRIAHDFDMGVLKILANGAEGGQGDYQIAQCAGAND